ncbi:hypothetical protein GEMRC1_004741 [Eukaryota sp. GEM-RC1]
MKADPNGYRYYSASFDYEAKTYELEGEYLDDYSWSLTVTCAHGKVRETKRRRFTSLCRTHTEDCQVLLSRVFLLEDAVNMDRKKTVNDVECNVYEKKEYSWCLHEPSGFVYEYCKSDQCITLSKHQELNPGDLQPDVDC